MAEEARDVWGKQVEFILTLIGYAVGLGNVWRFPFLAYSNGGGAFLILYVICLRVFLPLDFGNVWEAPFSPIADGLKTGGAFLIPYVVCLILLGIPMFALECAFGQYGGKGPLTIWSINPLFKGLGVSMVLISSMIFIYYNVVIAQAIRFFVASMNSDLPWMECNSCDCLLYSNPNRTMAEIEMLKTNNSLGKNCSDLNPNTTKSPSEIFYKVDILDDTGDMADIGHVQWELLLCNLVVYLIVFLVLVKGIASLGKMSYFTATFPYILLTIILVRVAMLDGAKDGVEFYLKPDWSRLSDAKVWSDAATQIFFSLSCCQGGLLAMASYNKFSNNIIRDAFVVPVINCLTSFYAGFVVFCTLGYMANLKNQEVKDVTKGGPGLVFIVYPEAIGAMPLSTLWAVLFFFMLSVLGFSSQFSIAETIMTAIADEFRWWFGNSRSRQVGMRFFVVMAGFVLGIPMCCQGGQDLLELVDGAVLGFPMLFVGLSEFILIAYIYGLKQFCEDIETMVGFSPFLYFKIAWKVVSPVVLIAVIVFMAYDLEEHEPAWKSLLYYLIIIFDLMWIPVGFLFFGRHALKEAMKPEEYWKQRKYQGKNIVATVDALSPSHVENGGGTVVEMKSKSKDGSYDNQGFSSGDKTAL